MMPTRNFSKYYEAHKDDRLLVSTMRLTKTEGLFFILVRTMILIKMK